MPRLSSALFALASLAVEACAANARFGGFDEIEYGYVNERSIWAPRAGLHLRIAEIGDGPRPPVVLVHPWGLNMSVWQELAPDLARDRRVLLVDLPGHGKSDKLHAAYPMRRLAAALADAMDAARIPEAVVIGNSLGGATAIELSLRHPERVRGLVLIGSPGGAPLPAPFRVAARQYARPRSIEHLSDEGWALGLLVAARGRSTTMVKLKDDLLAVRGTTEWRAHARAVATILRSVAEYEPEVERIQAPVLVVHGEADPVVRRSWSEALAERAPKGRLAEIASCGHIPEAECPEELSRLLTAFLVELER